MELDAMIQEYLEYGMSRQLRKKTLHSYEQALRMFSVWLAKEAGIHEVAQIREATIRKYVLSLQTRGKYTACSVEGTEESNHPSHRMDYGKTVSSITINNYLRNLRGFFNWLMDMEYMRYVEPLLLYYLCQTGACDSSRGKWIEHTFRDWSVQIGLTSERIYDEQVEEEYQMLISTGFEPGKRYSPLSPPFTQNR